jgi:membrane protein YqaA with SNARE-associated domain
MPGFDLSSPIVALGSAALLGFLSGILPTGMAEALAVAIGFVEPPQLSLGMYVTFTVTHVAAKLPWYWAGTHADRIKTAWVVRSVSRARELLRQRPGYGVGVLALSAVASVPPFHLASIAAGITRIPVLPFALICLAGRLVRFGVLAGVPMLLRLWWS